MFTLSQDRSLWQIDVMYQRTPPPCVCEGFEINQPRVGREQGFYLSKGTSRADSGFWHGKPSYSLLVEVFIVTITTLWSTWQKAIRSIEKHELKVQFQSKAGVKEINHAL